LSLRFHLERKTGGLTRVLERGRNAIETIVRMVILQLLPTIVEVVLLAGVLLYQFDWRYVLRSSSPSRSTCGSPISRPSGASRSAAA
jgi:ABC-type transport system involved in Fe-S cluster assembly fused permease/ATPase subunit